MLEAIKNFIFGKPREYESILITDEGTIFDTSVEPDVYEFNDFTGHIKFKGTDCDVENARFRLFIRKPEYLDKNAVILPAWNADINYMIWDDGIVRSGNVACKEWNDGKFLGDDLIVRGDFRNGVFKGRKFVAHVIKNAVVEAGAVNCGAWTKGVFKKGSIVCSTWECGIFEGGVFVEGVWLNGYFNGGTFKGIWKGGEFNSGIWMGDSRVGDGMQP